MSSIVNGPEDPEKYPGYTGECHPEAFTTMPPQPTEKKPGQMSPEKVKNFFENGFTVAEDVLTAEEIQSCKDSFSHLVDNIATKLYDTGRVKNMYKEYGLENRLWMLDKEWDGAVTMLLKLGQLTKEFQAVYQNEKLLNAVEQLIGPEIAANPVWNTRPKTPGHDETDVPWHQDSAYFDKESYSNIIITAWVALVDATEENGCLQFVKGAHKKGLIGVHQVSGNFYLTMDDAEMTKRFGSNPETDYISCPVKAGSVVFFSNIIPHRSLPNCSDHIRWAMDLRYQNPYKPWGYYGKSKGILLRSPDKPDIVPDWEFYTTQDRYEVNKQDDLEKAGKKPVDEFDTTLTGPHFDMWKINNINRHVAQHFADSEIEKAKQAAMK